VFDGVPVAIKDEINVRGYPTSVGARFLGTSPATKDSAVGILSTQHNTNLIFCSIHIHPCNLFNPFAYCK
jgi:hypothetical protein